jgi:hypothetical protein
MTVLAHAHQRGPIRYADYGVPEPLRVSDLVFEMVEITRAVRPQF